MGKIRKQKPRPRNFMPVRLECFDQGGISSPVEAIREQLLSGVVEEKLNGLQALAVLVGNKEGIASICSSDLVRICAPLLCENNNSIRNATAGALRNLSVYGGADVCDYLVEEDVLTPLLTLLNEFAVDVSWQPVFDNSMGGQLDVRSDVFLQSVNLLWNLCESSPTAVDMFNQTRLLECLIRCLQHATFGLEISLSVAQCILVVSENNPKSWNILNQHITTFVDLLKIRDTRNHMYLRTLVAGILSNVPALSAAYIGEILNTLTETLSVDHQTDIIDIVTCLSRQEDVRNSVPELEVDMNDIEEETEEAASRRRRTQELPTELDLNVKSLENLLDAQRVAAEVIANLTSPDEEEWVDAEGDDLSDGEDIVSDEDNEETNLQSENKLPVEIVEIIKSTELVNKLWQRSQPLNPNVVQQLVQLNRLALLSKTKNLHISCLICLQNLCNSLTSDDLGGPASIYNVWVNLGQQVLKGPQDPLILEPATSLMRAALEHLKKDAELFNQMTENDLQLMLEGVKKCNVAEIRANWLRMLGTLGYLLPEALVKIIMSFILEACSSEEDVWTLSEALDALMDMFSENDWNQIVVDLNLPVVVKKVEKLFKTKVRQQQRELKERYPAVKTVCANFSRFVKYVEKEAPKCKGETMVEH